MQAQIEQELKIKTWHAVGKLWLSRSAQMYFLETINRTRPYPIPKKKKKGEMCFKFSHRSAATKDKHDLQK